MNLWRAALELLHRGEAGALATVASTRGSTPVPSGTKMLIGADGRLAGTVGGGCVEAEVIAAAGEARHGAHPLLVTHHLNADLAGDLGLSCGGTVEILVEPLVSHPVYLAVLEAAAASERGIVTTAVVWSSGPDKTFAPLDAGARPAAGAELSPDRTRVIERLMPAPRLLVFGAGHVGSAIARAAHAAGFRVTVVDDRDEFADAARFPAGVDVWAADAEAAVARFGPAPADAIVVATRGHRQDAEIVARVAIAPADYVGLLGSRRKKEVVTRGLAAAGVPVEALARVRVPVGMDIGAETPEEIAVSVVAELIAWRRNRDRA